MFFIQFSGNWFLSWQLRFLVAMVLAVFGSSVFIVHEVVFIFVFPLIVGMMIEGWKQKAYAISETEQLQAYFLNHFGVLSIKEPAFKNAWFQSTPRLQSALKWLLGLKLSLHLALLFMLVRDFHIGDMWYANAAMLIGTLYMLYAFARTLSLCQMVRKARYQVMSCVIDAQEWVTFSNPQRETPQTFFNLLFVELEGRK